MVRRYEVASVSSLLRGMPGANKEAFKKAAEQASEIGEVVQGMEDAVEEAKAKHEGRVGA